MAKRTRSPSYPSISLETAIQRAEIIKKSEGWHAAPVDVVLSHWSYSAGSGAGLVQVAALKKYGLLEDSGRGDDRQVQLTSLAKDILVWHDERERLEAIRIAARSPKLYADVLAQWPDRLPSDAALRVYLCKKKSFNEKAIGDLIKSMKGTFVFAKLYDSDIIEDENGGAGDERESPERETPASERKKAPRMTPSADAIPVTVPLGNGSFEVISIPRMDAKAWAFFENLLKSYRSLIVTGGCEDSDDTDGGEAAPE